MGTDPPGIPPGLGVWLDWRPAPGQPRDAGHMASMLGLCEAAERYGYAAVWVSEHHCLDDGYLATPLPALAAIAARTSRIALGTGVLLAPLWPSRLLLEEASFVADLSGNRLLLGLGAGYWAPELEAFGVPQGERGIRLSHVVAELARMNRGEPLVDSRPIARPARPVPLVLGGATEAALRRAVRRADGYAAAANFDFRVVRTRYAQLQAAARQVGRPAPAFLAGINLWVTDDPEAAWAGPVGDAYRTQIDGYVHMGLPEPHLPRSGADLIDAGFLVGPADRIAAQLTRLAHDVPLTQLWFWAQPPGIGHLDALENLRRVAEEVAPHLRELLVSSPRPPAAAAES